MVSYSFESSDGFEVFFREPTERDAPQYLRMINGVIKEPRSGILLDRLSRLSDEKKWLGAALQGIKKRRIVMLAVEAGGVIKGNCDISLGVGKKSHRGTLGVVLSEDLRGKGVGEALMRRTIELAEKRLKGIEFIDLTVLDYNLRAKNLYTKLGFVEIGRIPRGIKEGSLYYDELIMTRPARDRKR